MRPFDTMRSNDSGSTDFGVRRQRVLIRMSVRMTLAHADGGQDQGKGQGSEKDCPGRQATLNDRINWQKGDLDREPKYQAGEPSYDSLRRGRPPSRKPSNAPDPEDVTKRHGGRARIEHPRLGTEEVVPPECQRLRGSEKPRSRTPSEESTRPPSEKKHQVDPVPGTRFRSVDTDLPGNLRLANTAGEIRMANTMESPEPC